MKQESQKRAVHRTKILQGQLEGLRKMIESEEYCMDILTQSLAIQRSLGSLNKLVLQSHLQTCVSRQLNSTDEQEQQQAIDELLKLYELHNVKGKA